MFERPIVRSAIGLLLGGLASLAVSFGPLALLVMIALALLFGFVSHSHAVVSGVLCGFGLVWLVLVGGSYTRCVAMGPNCSGSENLVPFLIIAGVAFVVGVALGLRAVIRDRAKAQVASRSAP
jgi:uncharacterized membrane protein YGL010W